MELEKNDVGNIKPNVHLKNEIYLSKNKMCIWKQIVPLHCEEALLLDIKCPTL